MYAGTFTLHPVSRKNKRANLPRSTCSTFLSSFFFAFLFTGHRFPYIIFLYFKVSISNSILKFREKQSSPHLDKHWHTSVTFKRLFPLKLFPAALNRRVCHRSQVGIAVCTDIENWNFAGSQFARGMARGVSLSHGWRRIWNLPRPTSPPLLPAPLRRQKISLFNGARKRSDEGEARYALGSSDWAVHGDRCRTDFAMLRLCYALLCRPAVLPAGSRSAWYFPYLYDYFYAPYGVYSEKLVRFILA